MPYQKIAQNLIESHCTLECFDVDFFDEQTSDAVAKELERLGCTVLREPHKSQLHVICPDGWKEGMAGA